MKTLISLIVVMVALAANAQPAVLRNPYTTNTFVGAIALTNHTAATVDFSLLSSDYATNANFTILAPLNVQSGRDNGSVLYVTNTSGSLITITPHAAMHAQGTWNCTNVTIISVAIPQGKWTNAIAYPLY